MKPTILHIIDSLGIGGAERIVHDVIHGMPDVAHILVYLKGQDEWNDWPPQVKGVHCLGMKRKGHFFRAVRRLKRIIQAEKVAIVHSHLYWATMVARQACPSHVKLVTTYHSLLYDPQNTAQYRNWMRWLDRLTYRDRMHTIYVSKAVKACVGPQVGISHRETVLHNFVHIPTKIRPLQPPNGPVKIVSVGNLRPEKQQMLLVEAMLELPPSMASLDIFGEGPLREELALMITEKKLSHVRLMGHDKEVLNQLPTYDLLVSASRFEGFGLAVAEAMAAGLPCLLSDIPAHREVAGEGDYYFDSGEQLSEKIQWLLAGPDRLSSFAEKLRFRSKLFLKEDYFEKLRDVYLNY